MLRGARLLGLRPFLARGLILSSQLNDGAGLRNYRRGERMAIAMGMRLSFS
jgi:hypothetical protein